jgi:hypothetical protein
MRTPDEPVLAFGRWVFCHICVHIHICRCVGCASILLLPNTCIYLYTYILVHRSFLRARCLVCLFTCLLAVSFLALEG